MRALRYAFDEATASLWRGRQSGLLSVATVAVALFVLGGFLIATANLQRLGDEWSRAAEMSVYLADDAGSINRAAIEQLLRDRQVVAGFEFVSKVDALARFKRTFTDLAATVDTLWRQPTARIVRSPAATDRRGPVSDGRVDRHAPGHGWRGRCAVRPAVAGSSACRRSARSAHSASCWAGCSPSPRR